MMMIKQGGAKLLLLAMLVVLLAGEASAASCNAGSLAPCVGAITGGSKPTAACCSNLRAQQGCFCQFAKNPAYGPYIRRPSARSTLTSCGLAVPRC